jgi:hypothetical protein
MSGKRSADTRADDPQCAAGPGKPGSPAPASGIVRRDELDAESSGGAPPWRVVHAYLARGEHRAWVEAHAHRSRAFAEVVEALRNDHEARRRDKPASLVPLRRRKPK